MRSEPTPPTEISSSLWSHRVFQQLFWAHALSLFGSGLSSLALGLLAHQLVGASASTVLGITLAIRIIVIVLISPWAGQIAARWGARQVMVASVDLAKNELRLSDTAYAWMMGAFGVGSVCGALAYSRISTRFRHASVTSAGPAMLAALVAVAMVPRYVVVMAAWALIGAGYSILGVRGSELLAEDSHGAERPHIFAAHFALSHAGWGLTYPLAGFLTTALGFGTTAWIFAAILFGVSIPVWIAEASENS